MIIKFINKLDSRAKIAIGLIFALGVLFDSILKLALFFAFFLVFMGVNGLFMKVIKAIKKARFLFLILFIVDYYVAGAEFAITVILRFALVISSFIFFAETTDPEEFALAIEKIGLPHRHAWALSLAFQQVNMVKDELESIREAQEVRGVNLRGKSIEALKNSRIIIIPMIVSITRRSWEIAKALNSRCFDPPWRRTIYRDIRIAKSDFLAVATILMIFLGIYLA